jgi:predicted nucleotidyltransferase
MNEKELMDNVAKVILENAAPKLIVLFGSRARGDSKLDSDYDLFILMPDGISIEATDRKIRRLLIDPNVSFDILVLTESEYRTKLQEGWLIFTEIQRDGKILYAA